VKKATSASKNAQAVAIELPAIDVQTMTVTLIGDSPLICHAWSQKQKQAMLDKQMGRAIMRKEKRDPEADYQASLYRMPDGKTYGFPSVAFKSAAVSACRFAEGVKMTELRGALHIAGELVGIEGKPQPREDMVRVGMGSADLRFRAQFPSWKVRLTVQYNAAVITPEQIANLFNLAGFSIGVGDWRPERDGLCGRFHVATAAEARR
jgi:hypothetical protein